MIVFPQDINQQTVFSIDNNKKCFLSTKPTHWEWFLKDYVTVKADIMATENAALPSQESITF